MNPMLVSGSDTVQRSLRGNVASPWANQGNGSLILMDNEDPVYVTESGRDLPTMQDGPFSDYR